jgi:hypothetical protein
VTKQTFAGEGFLRGSRDGVGDGDGDGANYGDGVEVLAMANGAVGYLQPSASGTASPSQSPSQSAFDLISAKFPNARVLHLGSILTSDQWDEMVARYETTNPKRVGFPGGIPPSALTDRTVRELCRSFPHVEELFTPAETSSRVIEVAKQKCPGLRVAHLGGMLDEKQYDDMMVAMASHDVNSNGDGDGNGARGRKRVILRDMTASFELEALTGQFYVDRDYSRTSYIITNRTEFPTVAAGTATAQKGMGTGTGMGHTVSLKSGKWYYECTIHTAGTIAQIGWADDGFAPREDNGDGVGDDSHSWGYDGARRRKWHDGGHDWGLRWGDGDIIGVAADLDQRTVSFSFNGGVCG